MWKLFFKKLWDSSVFMMLAWNSLIGPAPTLHETLWLTFFLVLLVGLLNLVLAEVIPLKEDLQPRSIVWTTYPLLAGLAYYVGPLLWHWIRA